jgi:hypothetical protein
LPLAGVLSVNSLNLDVDLYVILAVVSRLWSIRKKQTPQ